MIQNQIRQIKEKIVLDNFSFKNMEWFVTRTEEDGDALYCYNGLDARVHTFTNQYLIKNKIGEDPLSINCFRIAQGFIIN